MTRPAEYSDVEKKTTIAKTGKKMAMTATRMNGNRNGSPHFQKSETFNHPMPAHPYYYETGTLLRDNKHGERLYSGRYFTLGRTTIAGCNHDCGFWMPGWWMGPVDDVDSNDEHVGSNQAIIVWLIYRKTCCVPPARLSPSINKRLSILRRNAEPCRLRRFVDLCHGSTCI